MRTSESGKDSRPHFWLELLAGYPKDNQVSPGDIVATIHHCLGVDPHREMRDQFGRPMRICKGEPIKALLG